MRRATIAVAVLLVCAIAPAAAQTIQQSRGIDSRVDYTALDRLGPWDDRNYQLTAEDLALLAPNESELREAVPAFFRVEMRKAWPELPNSGPAQYPRSALQIFRLMFGGYLIDGKIHNKVSRANGRYVVDLSDGVPYEEGVNPRFLSGDVRVSTPNGGSESAVKIHPSNTNRVIAGSNGPSSGQTMHYSTNGGASWTQAAALPQGGTCCDPAVDWSSDGTFAYAATLGNCSFSGCAVWFYRSNDGGLTWNGLESTTPGDPRRELTSSGSDKEYVHVDQSPSSPFKDNVYLTWHNSNVMQFAVSTNFGNTWTTQAFSSLTEDRGIGSDVTTDHLGNVYYMWPAFNSRTIRLRKSTNGGVSFGTTSVIANTQASFIFPLPSIDVREAFVYVSADTDRNAGSAFLGSVYAAWTDSTAPTSGTPSFNHGRIQVAYSRNGGTSWTVTTPHETADASTVDRWHPWLAVGPDGKVHVVFYDTRRDSSRTSVDLFYSFSTDGAATWSTPVRLTSQISPSIDDSFEFGDYNGLDAVLNDVIAVFTDNRNESGGGADSVDIYAAGIAGTPAVCGNNTIEAGEVCDGTALGGQTCASFGCSGGSLACLGNCSDYDTSGCTGCPSCDNDGLCDPSEDCTSCPGDCPSGTTSGAACGNGVCEAGNGEDCVSCAADCNGVQGGKPANRFCCGDGGGQNPVSCSDSRCTSGSFDCTSTPVTPGSFCCGDATCEAGESCATCALDCTTGAEICNNGVDDDCNQAVDCADAACAASPSCQSPCDGDGVCDPGESCTTCPNECEGRTNGPPSGRYCCGNGVQESAETSAICDGNF